jgi:hypothetical protein
LVRPAARAAHKQQKKATKTALDDPLSLMMGQTLSHLPLMNRNNGVEVV